MLKIDGWKDAKIQDVLSNRTEKFDPKTTDEELNYIGLEHINQDSGTINGYGLSSDTTSMKTKFYEQDILYGKLRPYLRKYWHADFAGVCSTEILALKPKANNDSKFCYYLIQDDEVQNQVAAKTFGTKMPRTSWNELKQYEVSVPPLPEQKKIANILSTVDRHIDEVDGIIEDLKELKKGMMQKLLTEGIGHTEFKDSEVGRIPKDWEVKRFEEVVQIISGGTPSTKNDEYWADEVYWATPTDITSNGKFISSTEKMISMKGLENSSATLLPVNSVLMTSRATIGECCINKVPMSTNQGFKSFVCNEDMSYEFLYYKIAHIKEELLRLSSGSTFMEISKKAISSFPIAVPPVKEQLRISEILSSIDDRIESFQDDKADLTSMKKGLMQQLLTGKKRVTI